MMANPTEMLLKMVSKRVDLINKKVSDSTNVKATNITLRLK